MTDIDALIDRLRQTRLEVELDAAAALERMRDDSTALRARLAEVEGALREVISVSDRKTDIYDRAKAALASAGEEAGVPERLILDPAIAPGHTDLMVDPESIDDFMVRNPLPGEVGFHTPMPNPTPADLEDATFNAIWNVIKTWDVNVPAYYGGYCGAHGSHVMLILDALRSVPVQINLFRHPTGEAQDDE